MHNAPRSLLISGMRCFNVAAICALAVWHGYTFQLNQTIARTPQSPILELQLIDRSINDGHQTP